MIPAEAALNIYRSNVEEFDQAAPILTMVGHHTLSPVLLTNLPSDAEAATPGIIARIEPEYPLVQAFFSVEATIVFKSAPEESCDAVVIYSAGDDEYRAIVPFHRHEDNQVHWLDDVGEVMIGSDLDRDPVIVALRGLVERSNQ